MKTKMCFLFLLAMMFFSGKGEDPCSSSLDGIGNCTTYNITMSYGIRSYIVCLPESLRPLNYSAGFPVVLNFHGWGDTAAFDVEEAALFAANIPSIVVHPQGYADHKHPNLWGSWHPNGTAESPGPAGNTCIKGNTNYCYDSCAARPGGCDPLGCDWTTCVDDYEFATSLLNRLEEQFCIDKTREYASGCSNGGMMAYALGAAFTSRLAAIAPVCGSFQKGFVQFPDETYGIPVMDIHGSEDTEVPANLTQYNTDSDDQYPLSQDGWYYTLQSDIFAGWKKSNGCSGPEAHYPTSLDGEFDLYCISEGDCPKGDVVRCAWNGGHDYYGGSYNPINGQLVWEFLSKFQRK